MTGLKVLKLIEYLWIMDYHLGGPSAIITAENVRAVRNAIVKDRRCMASVHNSDASLAILLHNSEKMNTIKIAAKFVSCTQS